MLQLKDLGLVVEQADRTLTSSAVAAKLKSIVTEFKATLPVVVNLRCQSLKRRHWSSIHKILGYEIKVCGDPCSCPRGLAAIVVCLGVLQGVEGFSLGDLVSRRAMEHSDQISKIASEAIQEALLEESLARVSLLCCFTWKRLFYNRLTTVLVLLQSWWQEELIWAEVDLVIMPYKESRDVFVLGGVDDIVAKLDDSLVSVNTILGSRFVGPIRDTVDGVHSRLLLLQVHVLGC